MTRMRSAVSVCALSATLFLSGGAVAAADTGGEGGGTSSQGGSSTGESQTGAGTGTVSSTTKNARPGAVIAGILQDRIRTTVRDFTGALGGAGIHRQPPKVTIYPAPRTQQPASEPDTEASTESSTAPTATAEPDGAVQESAAPEPSTTPAVTGETAPVAGTPSTPASNSPFSFPAVKPPPVGLLAASVSGSLHSAADSVKDAVDALPALLASLPTSKDPIREVLATVQAVLNSVGDSVTTISAIPADISTLLGFPASTAPVTTTTIGDAALPTATVPAAVTPMDLLPALLAPPTPADTLGTVGPATAPPAFAGTISAGLTQELARTTPLSLHGASSAGATDSVLERAVSKLLVPVSIAALAALALPGLGGLLVVSALGVRIGYRQAKANFVLQASGIARFAGPGPLGVVRSGSFIALHTRTAHARSARTAQPVVVPLRAVASLDRAA